MINLTDVQIDKLFHLASVKKPESITSNDIDRVIVELEKKINPYTEAKSQLCSGEKAYVLIVDDLELSLHQLSLLLTKCGYTVHVARSKEEAQDKYQKHSYDYVLVDLFLPESQDGLDLLKIIVNSSKTKQDETKVIVISGTDNNELIQKCYQFGANEFVKKDSDWHKNILRHLRQFDLEKSGKVSNYYIEMIDNAEKVAYIRAKNINNPIVKHELTKEISVIANSGYSNIVFDVRDVVKLDSVGIELIVFAYKICTELNGSFKLCNVSGAVNEALSYVFLNNVIQTYSDKEEAVNSFR